MAPGWYRAARWPIAYILGALIIYWPILGIGLLSDDYVLTARASDLALFSGVDFFRPLPLLIWALLRKLLGDPGVYAVALHLLNVVLHGCNAWLVVRNLENCGLTRHAPAVAGIMFLLFPLSVEPVVWASAIFDVLLTTLVLTGLLLARSRLSSTLRLVALITITLAAIATKETAVAMPILLAIGLAAKGRLSRGDLRLLLAVTAIVVVYVSIRMIAGTNTAGFPPLTGYTLKELVSRPFAALAMPIHTQVATDHPLVTLAVAAVVPLLLIACAYAWGRDRAAVWLVVLCGGWVLASVAPVFTGMFVDAELQNARYLYLASVGWASLMTLCVDAIAAQWSARTALAIALSLGSAFAFIQREHLHAWRMAASTRDVVLNIVRSRPAQCSEIAVTDIPDNVAGAFVFRNGLIEAAADEGVRVVSDTGAVLPECVLRLHAGDSIPR